MKIKTIFVGFFLGILLLTLPVIASAYTLNIFGNANEDDTINMQDVTYTELIILEYKDETQLADAKYDNEIDILDVTQIELIILGRKKELTVLDLNDRIVTINMPVERIASSCRIQDIRTICALGAADKIVGVPDSITDNCPYDYSHLYTIINMAYPELSELPVAGSPYYGSPNLEVITSLEPDLILVSWTDANAVQEAIGVPVMEVHNPEPVLDFEELRFMGHILNKQERAEELISYYNDRLEQIKEVTSDIPDEEKPKVYLAIWGELTLTCAFYDPVELAGGENVAEGGTPGPLGPFMSQVSKEQIIDWNPDIILLHGGMKETFTINDVLLDPDLQSISAVQNERVYYTRAFAFGWDPAIGVIEASLYMPKLFYPDKFKDLDVEVESNEILEEVYGTDGIWTEMTELLDLYKW